MLLRVRRGLVGLGRDTPATVSSSPASIVLQVPKADGGGQPVPLIVGGVEKRDSLPVLTALCQSSGFESGKVYRADPAGSSCSCSLGVVEYVVSRTSP